MSNVNCLDTRVFFLQLIRHGIGAANNSSMSGDIDWPAIQALAEKQGLLAIMVDGLDWLKVNGEGSKDYLPPKPVMLQMVGEVLQEEKAYAVQQKAAAKMGRLFYQNGIRTYVLKGTVVAECYPNPMHRRSVDMDCYLLPEKSGFDAWTLGNNLIKTQGFKVEYEFYKNSTFYLPGLTVENHLYMVPFRGNERLKRLEKFFQSRIHGDTEPQRIEGTYLYRPPVMVTALFLIEHAYSHFLHEGLTWRMVLDWMMFSKKHKEELEWETLDVLIDEFGFRKFYDSFSRLGQYLIGEFKEFNGLSVQDKRMLEDVWSELDVHETLTGVKGKLALVGNTWRARWKYRYFTDMTWIQALWIQVKGFLFEKNPKLN